MKHKKYIISIIVLVVIAASLGGGYYLYQQNKLRDAQQTETNPGDINYGPPTYQDKDYNNTIKDALPTKSSGNQQPLSQDKKTVTPVISAWGQQAGSSTDFRVNGYVPDIVESDGSCTITLKKSGVLATATKAALYNAQSTSCGQLVIPYAQLSPGTWEAVLSYSSPHSSGESQKITVEVR